ncbi:ATP-binding cassette sub-family A member 2-like [Colias croceus]|uniref:ATP-binding cassette sub-family A member 2-like n=1 Tax=Colias crocea TaxID=72248 RepID=UPI001E2803C9|nr:ATP-binding cassette sub-family A member 2-like [Colias croceus]
MRGALWVLMYKHLVVRIRRFIQTPIELASPIVFFIILYLFKDKINPVPKSHAFDGWNIHNTEPTFLDKIKGPATIYYVPETDLTTLLMERVADRMGLPKQKLHSVDRINKGYIPLSNESQIEQVSSQMNNRDALVVFQVCMAIPNITGTWPEKLNYTIRMKNDFKTNSYAAESGSLGTHENFGTIYEPFLRLQWTIDTTYLQLLTGNDITQRVSLQEFPYAEATQNHTIELIGQLLGFLCWISLLLVFVFLMSRLLEERTTGIQELIKMVGVSSNLLSVSHFLNVLPVGIVYSIVGAALLTSSPNALIPNSNPVLIAIMMFLYFVTVVAMAFACSFLVKNPQYIVSLSTFAYVFLWIPVRLLEGRTLARTIAPFAALLPHAPMHCFWSEMVALEQYGLGITFANMATTHSQNCISVLACLIFLILQSAIFFTLALYLSLVNPGPYGQSLPWNFFCQKQYWSKRQVVPDADVEELEEMSDERDQLFFEQPPKDMEVGIKIVNVSKVFPKTRALNNVSLDVYKGEITVLLGHNGAGKTTLMSIITGMLSPTEGKVYVEGLDTCTQRDEMRQHLGLCPQHNLFFPDLTVLEHVMFFTMLKGSGYMEARSSSLKLLDHLGLGGKTHEQSGSLSGGMKRRLQLACALAGDARLLVLDEPTAGLDVESRRQLWDLLASLRGSRTVLLSTHFMEEADALGDRVAALHAGRLRCHATTMRLKRALGSGYRLSFTTVGLPNEPAITAAIQSKVPDASVKESSLNSISYNLPANSSNKFPEMFTMLEMNKPELGIDSIGVGKSTLEEVFLKLCSDVTTTFSDDTVDGQSEEPTYKKLTGLPLYWRQFRVLFVRQMKYIWSKKWSFLILQLFLPILMICLFTGTSNEEESPPGDSPQATMNMELFLGVWQPRVLYRVNQSSLRGISDAYPKVDFVMADDVADNILRISKRDQLEYNKYLVGVELNDTDAKVLYTTRIRHAAPVAMNLLTNVLATQLLPWADGTTLTTINHPLLRERAYIHQDIVEPKSTIMAVMWASCIVFIILATAIMSVSLPCKERASGTRHLHIMAGASPQLYWLATLLAHALLYTVLLVLPTLITAVTLEKEGTINQGDFLGTLTLTLICGIVAFLSFMYAISFHFGERSAGVLLAAAAVIFGFITPTIKTASEIISETEAKSFGDYILILISYTLPPHALTTATMKGVNVARLNAYCHLNRDKCPNLFVMDNGFDVKKCCEENINPRCYFCFDGYAPAGYILVLFLQSIFYMGIVIATELGIFNYLCDRVFNSKYNPTSSDNIDEIVRAEKAYVSKAISLPKRQIQDMMLVDDVHKNYVRFLGKSCNAVKGVSFSIKKGECFGLLGVNGAGKSTTFKMLTADECATRGQIFANGNHLGKMPGQYLNSLGYCPQFSGMDEFLTGRENLVLLMTLRGLNDQDTANEAQAWIDVVGLAKYSERPVSGYSGGCSRRLGAAACVSGGAALALLDEPTAGVDVAARRRVWAALRRANRAKRSAVISSHSMDEMEALCSRIAIMSGGRVRALGSAAALRAQHAAGHALCIKLAPVGTGDETDSSKPDVLQLKRTLQEKFNCTLKDEHKTMLHYHINDTLRYSELFTELEALREQYPSLLEDYSVTETTLEEVFLSFAKEQHSDDSPA